MEFPFLLKPYLHKGAEDLTNLAYSCDTALCSEVFSGFQNSNSAAGLISHKDRAELKLNANRFR